MLGRQKDTTMIPTVRNENILPEYSGQIISVADVCIELGVIKFAVF